ncbi:50S ribosomal protein L6 [Candidatus Berkelbacteria bacterium]|nr:50S ribosomal protein L6 [Candidatus Berkelbacteria bacterium]
MSKIGRKPIILSDEIKVSREGERLLVQGPKGKLEVKIPAKINVSLENQVIKVSRLSNDKESRALHGLIRALINNASSGVREGFQKSLLLRGVGFRAELKEGDLHLQLGFSHPVVVKKEEGLDLEVAKKGSDTVITVSGIDKQKVGQFAAELRAQKPPEPYKGKGFRYLDEEIKLKPGKSAKSTVGA